MPTPKRILICDDSMTLRELIKVYLLGNDYVFAEARTSDEALRLAQREKPDLILCDLKMPGLDGIELRQTLVRDAALKAIPFVLVTAVRDESLRQRCAAAGITGFLSKPLAQGELVSLVKSILEPGH